MRLIDADELRMANHWRNVSAKTFKRIVEIISIAPTINAEPVVHANRNRVRTCKDIEGEDPLIFYSYECSNCGVRISRDCNYCRYCGARMDGTVNVK